MSGHGSGGGGNSQSPSPKTTGHNGGSNNRSLLIVGAILLVLFYFWKVGHAIRTYQSTESPAVTASSGYSSSTTVTRETAAGTPSKTTVQTQTTLESSSSSSLSQGTMTSSSASVSVSTSSSSSVSASMTSMTASTMPEMIDCDQAGTDSSELKPHVLQPKGTAGDTIWFRSTKGPSGLTWYAFPSDPAVVSICDKNDPRVCITADNLHLHHGFMPLVEVKNQTDEPVSFYCVYT